MTEESIPLCPFNRRPCATKKCNLWQRYSYNYFINSGETGECLLKLQAEAIIMKYAPSLTDRYYDTDNDPSDSPVEVPF